MATLKDRLASFFARPSVPVLLAWIGLCILFISRFWNADLLTLIGDTDDATRLVTVRDFLGGQNWFDHLQHRFNTPWGAEIHWSRLIDLPLGALITVFNVIAPGQGERIALFVWPLLWLLPALYLTAKLTRHLLGPGNTTVALVLAALSLPLHYEFAPGRIDHHNVQIVLVLWLVLETLKARTISNSVWWAGLAAATSLAIGAETLPVIAAAIVAFGLYWVFDAGFAPRLWRFGVAFAGATLLHFFIAVRPSEWFAVHCDALSLVYVAAAFGVAIVFGILALLPLPASAHLPRLGFGLAGAALIGIVLFEVFPRCAAGPYAALGPFLRDAWLAEIVEARPLWTSLFQLPVFTIAATLPVLLALGGGIHRLATCRNGTRQDWLTYTLVLLGAVFGMMLQLRGVRPTALLAVPGAVALIMSVRERYLSRKGIGRLSAAFGLVVIWICAAGLVVYAIAGLVIPKDEEDAGGSSLGSCLSDEAFMPLARLSPARVAAPVDLGPYILLMTPHAVMGAPYHRNTDGITDSLRVFGASEEAAWRVIKRRGIDLVVMCDEMLAVTGNGFNAPDSIKSLFAVGGQPDWLNPLPAPDGALRVYRVAR